MKVSGIILLAGIVFLLSGPLVALTPVFTPPPNGCPCPEGLNYSTPFGATGVSFGAVGMALILYCSVQRRRTLGTQGKGSHGENEVAIVAVFGVVLLVLSSILSGIVLRGPGWVIAPYGAQGLYLGTLGIGTLLFAGFASITKE